MAFLSSLDITGSALTAERFRIDIIAQNLSNYKTTMTASGEPYRRKQVIFEERGLSFDNALAEAGRQYSGKSGGVRVASVVESTRDFKPVYDPSHPQANEEGYVMYPNVDTSEEMLDLMAASNAYDTNLATMSVLKAMINKTIEMGR